MTTSDSTASDHPDPAAPPSRPTWRDRAFRIRAVVGALVAGHVVGVFGGYAVSSALAGDESSTSGFPPSSNGTPPSGAPGGTGSTGADDTSTAG
ncbi:hypothetical protein [Nocardioides mangrovi]|uniref:Uncharacterized protein n=1 Tax=Nocardioides mangrovi TaxID=2874580 RepID=A0ABS7UHG1_9ACTN|nr:hypothetical protein [Nocardioides mangrovi]MBZ5740464.1 hypothetical protein [Nocardioides mangrovi]